MRILLIHNKYIHRGGEDTVFEAEYDLLVKEGHNVESFLFDNKKLTSIGSKFSILWKLFFNIDSFKRINKIINEFNPDVIHVHNFFPIASPSVFYSANKYNIPVVMTLHNYRLICPNALMFRDNQVCELCVQSKFAFKSIIYGCYRKSRVQTFLLALMLYIHKITGTWEVKVDKYITLTKFAKNTFLKSSLNLSSSQLIIKPNFVVNDVYDFQKDNYYLFVGRLSEEKGINILLQAFQGSKRELVIIGDGPLRHKVEKYVSENKNIKYLGFQTKNIILKKMIKAKALIFTSIWYETFGMTIVEAFSCATPVIYSDIGAPAELVTDGVTGLKFQVGDYADLKQKIDLLYMNDALHEQLCQNARNKYENKYTADNNYRQLMKIYEGVISEQK